MRRPKRAPEPVDDDPWRVAPTPGVTTRQRALARAGQLGSALATGGRAAGGQLGSAVVTGGRVAGERASLTGQRLSALVDQLAPHVTVRSRGLLEKTYGCEGDALAEELIRAATHVTASLGAAAGALAGVEFVAPPALLAVPVQMAAETVSVLAVELRLLGELHEVYGVPVVGTAPVRVGALLNTWTRRRALEPGAGVLLLGAAARRELRHRLLRRAGASATTMAPFLAGAAAGAEINRRETRKLGDSVAADLRVRALPAFPPGRLIEAELRADGSPA